MSRKVVKRLSGKGLIWTVHSVEVSGPTSAGGVETFVSDYFEFADIPQGLMGLAGGSVEKKPDIHYRVAVLAKREHSFLPLGLRLAKAMVKRRHLLGDVVVLHRVELVLPLKLVRPRAKIILIVHTDLSKQASFFSGRRWALEGPAFQIYEFFALWLPSRILVYSKNDYPRILQKNKGTLLGTAWVNDRIFTGATGQEKRTGILWAGRLERVKNPLLALRAFALTIDKHSHCLLMVGDGILAEEVASLAEELALGNRVTFSASMGRRQLAEEMLSREVLLMSSHFEGAPRVIVEAIQQGMKVVATEGSDPENLIRQKKPSWVSQESAEDLSQALIDALGCSARLPLGKLSEEQKAEFAVRQIQQVFLSAVDNA